MLYRGIWGCIGMNSDVESLIYRGVWRCIGVYGDTSRCIIVY